MSRLTTLANIGALTSEELRLGALDKTGVVKLHAALAKLGVIAGKQDSADDGSALWDSAATETVKYDPDMTIDEAELGPVEQTLVDLGYYSPVSTRHIAAASVNALVARIAQSDCDSFEEVTFQSTFLKTYRSWCTPAVLLTKLTQRYHVPWPRDITTDDLSEAAFDRTVARPIQLRVVSFLTQWVLGHFEDFDDALVGKLTAFADTVIAQDSIPLSNKVRTAIARRLARAPHEDAPVDLSGCPAVSLPPGIPPSRLTLADIPPLEMARQLTLMAEALFITIQPSELHKCIWLEPDAATHAPHVLAMQAFFNKVAGIVSASVVTPEKTAARAAAFSMWVHVASECRALHNLDTANAIIGGLGNSAVHRLKSTKSALTRRVADELAEIRAIMDPTGSYAGLRAEINAAGGNPCLPYLGMFLTDLTFAHEANDDIIDGLVNWDKAQLIAGIITRIQDLQARRYALVKVEAVEALIGRSPVLEEAELDKMSARAEPR